MSATASEDLARVEALGLPATLTERSSLPTKRHMYFRPPPELEVVAQVSFRFEKGTLTAAESNYYVCAPALHESGTVYAHLPGLGPDETEIAALPAAIYHRLVAEAAEEARVEKQALRHDPAAKVPFGRRHDVVFRFACAMRRWTSSEDEILKMALVYNETHCDPPMTERRVRSQVRGAMKMADRPPDPRRRRAAAARRTSSCGSSWPARSSRHHRAQGPEAVAGGPSP